MEVDARVKGKGKKGKGGKGHIVKGKGKDTKGKRTQTRFAGKCWHCGKQGHRSQDCWNKSVNAVEQQGPEPKAKAKPKA
eukprot:11052450-Alexandrium_andersonii.AAC.1